jgi:hypothetical protein
LLSHESVVGADKPLDEDELHDATSMVDEREQSQNTAGGELISGQSLKKWPEEHMKYEESIARALT